MGDTFCVLTIAAVVAAVIGSFAGLIWHCNHVVAEYHQSSYYIPARCDVQTVQNKGLKFCRYCYDIEDTDGGYSEVCRSSAYPCYNVTVTIKDDRGIERRALI